MALMLASSQWASAQSRSVKVNVQDSWGPVAGASVLIKGTTTGDVTDLDGNATITNIEESSVLVVSFIGYTSQEIVVGKQTQINVVMKEDTELLDETVVVGYGTQKKESLTSAITSVRAEDITKTKQNDVVTSLRARCQASSSGSLAVLPEASEQTSAFVDMVLRLSLLTAWYVPAHIQIPKRALPPISNSLSSTRRISKAFLS